MFLNASTSETNESELSMGTSADQAPDGQPAAADEASGGCSDEPEVQSPPRVDVTAQPGPSSQSNSLPDISDAVEDDNA